MSSGQIFETQDGSHSIYSAKYGVSYHSKYGAVQESRHVFLEAGLRFRAPGRSELAILEIGFGSGLNAFLSLLEAENRRLNIYYETLEAHPIEVEQALLLNYPQNLQVAPLYADLFSLLHTSPWGFENRISPYFTLRKENTKFESFRSHSRFDVIFYDAFAPDAQPELWEESMFANMYESLLPKGVLVTYCAKGAVKRSMRSVGFQVEALPGPPGKREMTRGVKPG